MGWLLPVDAVNRAVHGVVDGFDWKPSRRFLWRARRGALGLRRRYVPLIVTGQGPPRS